MNQIPCMPVNPIPVPQQPSYNAVKIDIHNPSVGVPQMQAPQNAYYNPQYAPVTSPIYNIPQAPIYYPAPMPQPQAPVEQIQTQHLQTPVVTHVKDRTSIGLSFLLIPLAAILQSL